MALLDCSLDVESAEGASAGVDDVGVLDEGVEDASVLGADGVDASLDGAELSVVLFSVLPAPSEEASVFSPPSDEVTSDVSSGTEYPASPRLSYQACGYLGFGLWAASETFTEPSSPGRVSLAIITSLALANSLLPMQVTRVKTLSV